MHPVEANEIFVALGQERKLALRQSGFEFYDWNTAGSGQAPLRRVVGPARGGRPRAVCRARKTQVSARARQAHNSRRPTVTGKRAARTAGNNPPMKPMANAHLRPSTTAGESR